MPDGALRVANVTRLAPNAYVAGLPEPSLRIRIDLCPGTRIGGALIV